jgi:hypothetical protein
MMTIEDRIQNEFNDDVTILEFGKPQNKAPVGLVRRADNSFCVVELDDEGNIPFFHDFSPVEELEARMCYADLGGCPARKTVDSAIYEEMYGPALDELPPMEEYEEALALEF